MRHVPLLLLALGACMPDSRITDPSGTAVGNPGADVSMQTQAAADVASLSGTVPVSGITVVSCAGDRQPLSAPDALSAVAADSFAIPEGDPCRLRVSLSGPLHLEGTDRSGHPFRLDLDVPVLSVTGPAGGFASVPGQSLVFLLGPPEWLSAAQLGTSADGEVVVDAASTPARHDTLVRLIEGHSRLFVDGNGDRLQGPREPAIAASNAADLGALGPGGTGDTDDDDDAWDDTGDDDTGEDDS